MSDSFFVKVTEVDLEEKSVTIDTITEYEVKNLNRGS